LRQYAEKRLGTAVPRLNIADIRKFRIGIPPLAEQRRIVAKLDALTARLAHASADLDRVASLAKHLRMAALVDRLHSSVAHTVRVGDVVEDIRYGTSKRCDYAGGKTPVLRIPNVQRGQIDVTDLKSAEFDLREIKKLSLRLGDVLVIRCFRAEKVF
jgi:type I restriction enzyme, S subunit